MKKIFIALISIVFLISVSCALADGGYFPSPGHWVRPGQQEAVIFHEDNTENLIVTSGFKGDAEDLVWIVPTPSKPEVKKADEKFFDNIEELAEPQYNRGPVSYGMMAEKAMGREDSGVEVIKSKEVDYYDVNILTATDSKELVEWFNKNNYSYPKEYEHVLNHYISKGWYFTAIKVSPEAQDATGVEQDLTEGHPTPVKLTFLSDKIVYPLKISSVEFEEGFEILDNVDITEDATSHFKKLGYKKLTEKESFEKVTNQIIVDVLKDVSYKDSIASDYGIIITRSDYESRLSDYNNNYNSVEKRLGSLLNSYLTTNDLSYGRSRHDYVPIHLYVIADGKYEADYFDIIFGDWVKDEEIEDLGENDKGQPYLKPSNNKYYLTYLNARMQKSQMDDDVFLEKSDNNRKVNAGPGIGTILIQGLLVGMLILMSWIFTPIGLLFIIGCLILFLSRNEVAKIIGWVIETISLVLTIIISLLVLIYTPTNHVTNSILITLSFLIIVIVLLMILQKLHKKGGK